jgi:hypothetical protein
MSKSFAEREYDIECMVERKTNSLDRMFMAGAYTQAEYDARIKEINKEADKAYKAVRS